MQIVALCFAFITPIVAFRDKGSEMLALETSRDNLSATLPGFCDAQSDVEDLGRKQTYCRAYVSEANCKNVYDFCTWKEGIVEPGYCEGTSEEKNLWCRRGNDFQTCTSPDCKWVLGIPSGYCAAKKTSQQKYCTETVTDRSMCLRATAACEWVPTPAAIVGVQPADESWTSYVTSYLTGGDGYCDAKWTASTTDIASEQYYCRENVDKTSCDNGPKFCTWKEGKVEPGYCDAATLTSGEQASWCRRTYSFQSCTSPACTWKVGKPSGKCVAKEASQEYCTETVTDRSMCERATRACQWIE